MSDYRDVHWLAREMGKLRTYFEEIRDFTPEEADMILEYTMLCFREIDREPEPDQRTPEEAHQCALRLVKAGQDIIDRQQGRKVEWPPITLDGKPN